MHKLGKKEKKKLERILSKVPIDVEEICELYHIDIGFFDFSKIEKNAGRKIDSALLADPDGYKILVNRNHWGLRTTFLFCIAREMGRAYLMRDKLEKVGVSVQRVISPDDRKLDTWATRFLIPEDLLRKEHAKLVIPVAKSLADEFDVPLKAMQNRLDELELMYI